LVPKPAQYLLRFDDLCPTIFHRRWEQFRGLITEFGIKPILAVVPANQDRALEADKPDPGFWESIRAMEAAGAMIGLHGYRHVCHSPGQSLVPLHRHSEFAGVAAETQRQWIDAGLKILRGHGLNPRIWVAPRHGFDRNTLLALKREGIRLLSDGFARIPFTRGGLTWLPQQHWSPVHRAKGLWTVCLHPNTATEAQVEELRAFLSRHAVHFTSVDRVLSELLPEPLSPIERLYEMVALERVKASRGRKKRRSKLAR
jgi:predicted deacetylase